VILAIALSLVFTMASLFAIEALVETIGKTRRLAGVMFRSAPSIELLPESDRENVPETADEAV
jgi:hypothetical protein